MAWINKYMGEGCVYLWHTTRWYVTKWQINVWVNLINISSGNDLSPVWRQASTWRNADVLSIVQQEQITVKSEWKENMVSHMDTLENSACEILQFCVGFNVLKETLRSTKTTDKSQTDSSYCSGVICLSHLKLLQNESSWHMLKYCPKC